MKWMALPLQILTASPRIPGRGAEVVRVESGVGSSGLEAIRRWTTSLPVATDKMAARAMLDRIPQRRAV